MLSHPKGTAGASKQVPFRFIHASDFHLDRPISGLSDLPEELKSTFASASYAASARVFEAAISERAAFVLLSGNIVDLEMGGPRSIAFLLDQFGKLAERDIQVFWCGGETDVLDRWPSSIAVPKNVHLFRSTLVDTVPFYQNEKLVANIVGASNDPHRSGLKEFHDQSTDVFSIAMTNGEYDVKTADSVGIEYFALGGQLNRQIHSTKGKCAAYPGSPQGRTKEETGSKGAILVSVESSGMIRTQALECETARWLPQSLSVAETIKFEALKDLLSDRVFQLLSKMPEANLLVHWTVATTGNYEAEFRKKGIREKLIHWLRKEFGNTPGLWSVDLQFTAPQKIDQALFEEDTILGDFLREVGRYKSDSSIPIGLHTYESSDQEIPKVGRLSSIDPESRTNLLEKLQLEALEFLGGNET